MQAVLYRGGTIYVGGDFTKATDASGTVVRRHLAAVDARSGRLLTWRPAANGVVRALAASDGRIHVGGAFTRVNGVRRSRLASVERSGRGRVVRGYHPHVNGTVEALAAGRGRTYVGGDFTAVSGRPRTRLAALDSRTGDLTGWRPSANLLGPGRQLLDGRLGARHR